MSTGSTWFGGENYDPDPNLKIWLDGKIVPVAEAKVSVFDHGLLYGDGIFEGIRSYNGRIFEREAHLHRFFESAKAIRLTLPYTFEQIDKAMDDTLEANGRLRPDQDAYIRMVATRGVGVLGISPLRTWKPQVYIIAGTIKMYPQEMYEKGMPVIVSSVTRNHSNATPPRIKSLNYLNNILAKIEANTAGVEEAIMLNAEGYVAECTGDNLFIVKAGQLHTPPLSAGALYGITRGVVMELAAAEGVKVSETNLTRYDVFNADECFLTGTGAEIIPVVKVDGRVVGTGKPGPLTRNLVAKYHALTQTSGEPIR